MSIQLTQRDFQELVRIVQKLADFRTETGRWRLVDAALEGSPRADTLRGLLDLSGNAMGAAVTVIKTLADFGQVVYGQEALGIFLNYVLLMLGEGQDRDFIRDLFSRYPLGSTTAVEPSLKNWRSGETLAQVQEKIIGENTLRDVRMLELALEASRAVALLRITPPGETGHLGTGFMIAPTLLMTNHHVIRDQAEAKATSAVFNYQLDRLGRECIPETIQTLPDGLFYTHAGLDFAVVELRQAPTTGMPLLLTPALAQIDQRVAIIQHPGGHLKKISMQNNRVVYADRQTVQYTTSTLPGSSGSPVFDDEFQVIVLHHSGGTLEEPGTGRYYQRNAGTSLIAILEELRQHAPQIYQQIKHTP